MNCYCGSGRMNRNHLRTLLASLTHRADALVEQGDFEAAKRIHVVWATSLYALSYFIPIFSAIYFGTAVIEGLVGVIPEWLTNGLTVASKILPAYGFALLLNTMMTSKNVVFLLAGFFITAYSGISVTAISIFAVIVAFILADIKFNRPAASAVGAAPIDFEDYDDLDLPDDL